MAAQSVMTDPKDAVRQQAGQAIQAGSKSFAAAARLLGRESRDGAILLYAWCRHCDDVIDGQVLGHAGTGDAPASPEQARCALARLERETLAVLDGAEPCDPAFAALAHAVRRHEIPRRHPLDLLEGFRMDVEGRRYETIEDTLEYCYHVAGVVGVMMAFVLGVRDPEVVDRACDLGLAFQLTNIARDVIADATVGRVYLPEAWLAREGLSAEGLRRGLELGENVALARVVARLLAAAAPYYASAKAGIAALPPRSAWAIATARAVYRDIGTEILARGPNAWDRRVSTSRSRKLVLILGGGLQAVRRNGIFEASRQGLWTRPA